MLDEHDPREMNNTITQAVRDLLGSLPKRRRRQLLLLLGLMIAGAVTEVVSLGAILPFLAILVDPQQALQTPLIARVVAALGLGFTDDLRWYLTLIFAATAVAAGVVRYALTYVTARLNFGIGHEMGAEIYRRTLYQPYEVHIARNSSEIMGGLGKVDAVVWVVFAMLNMASASLMAIFIVIALLLIDPFLAMATLLGLGGIYTTISLIARKQLIRNSRVISQAMNRRVQTLQEGLGGIRDVLLDHSQVLFSRRFNDIDWPIRQAQASNNIIGPSPRFAVEALGMVLIAFLAYSMAISKGGLAASMPALGALALGAQRLMPLIQQAYQSWIQVSGNRQLLHDVVVLLQQPVSEEVRSEIKRLPFDREIRFEQVSFRYQPKQPFVLEKIDLTFAKGGRIGFVGTTGSGKSTAMDLLMGLLQPSAGLIRVDGMPLTGAARLCWQSNIAHVPQAIYLTDTSFADNIAFGIPPEKIDLSRVRKAAFQAQISEFIDSQPAGYNSIVGERGVRLSGGQRQRIAIARALYKQADVIVFDEATSALDNDTELAVMEAIEGLSKDITIFIIAHRISTLKNCTQIVELMAGGGIRVGTYQDILSSSHESAEKLGT